MPLRGLWHDDGGLRPGFQERLDGNRAILRRVAHHVSAFTWDASGTNHLPQPTLICTWLPDYLAALQPDRMAALRLLNVPHVPKGLGRLSHLTRLELDSAPGAHDLASAIAQMRQLADLCCHTFVVSDDMMASVLQLTGLTRLDLSVALSALPPAAAELTRLAQLQDLSLKDTIYSGNPGLVQMLTPADFAHRLRSFHFFRAPRPLEASAVCVCEAASPPVRCGASSRRRNPSWHAGTPQCRQPHAHAIGLACSGWHVKPHSQSLPFLNAAGGGHPDVSLPLPA